MKKLIVTADDFGAAYEVNEAVERAHREGVLSAASLMVGARAAEDAVARAKANPGLRVGLHLVLVEARALLGKRALPDLVDEAGFFRTDMARMGAAIFALPHVRRQAKAEIVAQFSAFAATGLRLDHVNMHKHYHLHPTIASIVLEVGGAYGLPAVRAPCEPQMILNRIEPGASSPVHHLADAFARARRAQFRRAGWLTPDFVFGLRWSGAMTRERLLGLITNLPDGLSEIYMHPALCGGFEGAAAGYRYREELAALCAQDVIEAAQAIERGGFADFQAGARACQPFPEPLPREGIASQRRHVSPSPDVS